MAEFSGNVHDLELALPFPAPVVGGGPYFVTGRTFGVDGSDLLDVWVDDSEENTFDPPDGQPLSLHIRTLIACTHGWLSFVAAGQPVPGLVRRDGSPLVVTDATLVLEVWSTLHSSLDRMAEDGSYFVELTQTGRGGRPALGHLLYENVDLQTLDVAIEAPHRRVASRPLLLGGGARSDGAVVPSRRDPHPRAGRARSGRGRGRRSRSGAVPTGADVSWRRATFRAADRLGQLFDPGFLFRRIQDLADIVEVPLLVEKSLIPSRAAVKDHSLPQATGRRLIVDWRDEFGRPVPNARFALPPATGPATDFVATDAAGLWVGPPLAAGADPRAITALTLIAEAPGARLGTLPDSPGSSASLEREQMADDYLIVSAIDLEQWFPARIPPSSPSVEPLRRFSEGNRVTAMIDGRRTYSMIYRALRRTFRDDDFAGVDEGGRPVQEGPLLADTDGNRIYVAGWKLSPELWLPDFAPEAEPVPDYDPQAVMTAGAFDPRGHLMGMLRAAIAAGVDVRTLLWRQQQESPDHHSDNTAAVLFVNREEAGRRGEAILDAVGRTVGSHHQKALVVQNADGRLAFVGGIDLALGRWDTQEHLPGDERARGGRDPAGEGWHDTQVMIEGPAVDDVEANFRQRWNAHPDAALGGRTTVPARSPGEVLDPIPQATHFVQINRTVPQGVPHFSFADPAQGDPGARLARVNAIRRARRFVYIEEQYLTMFDWEDYESLVTSHGSSQLRAGRPRYRRRGVARPPRRAEPDRLRRDPDPARTRRRPAVRGRRPLRTAQAVHHVRHARPER